MCRRLETDLFRLVSYFLVCFTISIHVESADNQYIYSYEPHCAATCPLRLRSALNGSVTTQGNCNIIRKTPHCSTIYKKTLSKEATRKYDIDGYPACDMAVVSFWINSIPIRLPPSNLLQPQVRLNITVVVSPPEDRVLPTVDAVKFELDCITGSVNENLCFVEPSTASNDRKPKEHEMLHEKMHWPCRLFDMNEYSGNDSQWRVQFPAAFSYSCLRANPLTGLRVNVTLHPLNCTSHYYIHIPSPKVCDEKSLCGGLVAPADAYRLAWRPLVHIEASAQQRVAVVFEKPNKKLGVKEVEIHIAQYRQVGGRSKLVSVDRKIVKPSVANFGATFKGLKRGWYVAYVSILDKKCDQFRGRCPNITCSICQHSIVHFYVPQDHHPITNPPPPFVNIHIFLLVVFLFIAVLLAFIFYRVRLELNRREAGRPPPETVEMVSFPKVLLLYTDDSLQHRNCVLEFAKYLQSYAQCQILLDEWALSVPGEQPSQWLLNVLETADFVVVIFSAGSHEVFQGRELENQRHWAELFTPGLTLVMQELVAACRQRQSSTNNGSNAKLKKYLWLRFSYSHRNCIEPFLASLPVKQLELPGDWKTVIAHLHGLSIDEVTQSLAEDCSELREAVSATHEHYTSHPGWLVERLRARGTTPSNHLATTAQDLLSVLGSRDLAARESPTAAHARVAAQNDAVPLPAADRLRSRQFELVGPEVELPAVVTGPIRQNGNVNSERFALVGSPEESDSESEGDQALLVT